MSLNPLTIFVKLYIYKENLCKISNSVVHPVKYLILKKEVALI